MSSARRSEEGSITIWMATASFVMMTLVGLAVDLGGQVHAQQRAHDLAAQAARAGGEQVQAGPAVQGRYAAIDSASARRAAQQYLSTAGVSGTVAIRGTDTITVTVADTYTTRFLGLIGLGQLDVNGTASAHLIRSIGGSSR